jgi:3',5'-cyclic AMP phosphodiesterase CpdA
MTLETNNPQAEAFTFVHVSDTQAYPDYFKRVLTSVVGKANFLLHTGDVVESSKYEYEWTAMLDGNKEYLSQIPIMAISGNHETTYKNGSNETFKHFNYNIPQQKETSLGFFYSFEYGNVKFIMLNTNDLANSQLKPEQYDWLVQELKNNDSKWTIVSMHNPMYSVGQWGADTSKNGIALSLRTQLQGIFAQYGVDIVLQGHDHTINRTHPIDRNGRPQTENFEIMSGVDYSINPKGTIYLTNGTAGGQNEKPYIVDASNEHLYSYTDKSQKSTWAEISVSGDSLTVSVKYHDGDKDNVQYTWGIKKTA